jgi:chaperonin cofactor prefoldin
MVKRTGSTVLDKEGDVLGRAEIGITDYAKVGGYFLRTLDNHNRVLSDLVKRIQVLEEKVKRLEDNAA